MRARDLAWGIGRALCAVCLEIKKSARSILQSWPTGLPRVTTRSCYWRRLGRPPLAPPHGRPNGVTAQIFPRVNNAMPRLRLDY